MSVESDLLDQMTVYVASINTDTNRIGAALIEKDNTIQALTDQINAGTPVTVEQLTALRDGLKADSEALTALGNTPPPPARKR